MSNARTFVSGIAELPPMPDVATRVLGFVEDDNRNGAELARIVGADPALSARLIKVSNSAYYGFARRLGTVREAVLVLGFRQVRQIVLGASLMEAWKRIRPCEGFSTDLFWEHSLAVAMAAETAARLDGHVRPEEAFTAGILHDIGLLALLIGDQSRMAAALRLARGGAGLLEAEQITFGFDHAEAGAALAERWHFPEVLVTAIGGHHTGLGRGNGLPGTVALASRLAEANGLLGGHRVAHAGGALAPDVGELDRACGGFSAVSERARAFIESVGGASRSTAAA